MTLYEMSNTARQLYELFEAGEIDEQTVTDTMESIGASEKLESYVYIQRQLEAEIAGYKAEIERMTDRVHSLQSHVDRMRQAQVDFMQATGQKKANAGLFKLSLRENKSCEIEDESLIPAEYMTVIPETWKPDKRAMLAAMKQGERINGAKLTTSYSVTVK